MQQRLKIFIISLGLCFAVAQGQVDDIGTYGGVGADLFIGGGFAVPLPSFQLGTEIAPHFELRGSLVTIFLISILGVDALYTYSTPDSALRYYVGGGPDLVLLFNIGDPNSGPFPFLFAAHATAGLEYRHNELIGLYAEGQPFLIFGGDLTPGVRLRSGVNFHF